VKKDIAFNMKTSQLFALILVSTSIVALAQPLPTVLWHGVSRMSNECEKAADSQFINRWAILATLLGNNNMEKKTIVG
jgi:hypothetical protein